MTHQIVPFSPEHKTPIVALSLRAWEPVFEKLEPAVPPYVYEAFYPEGWRVRQVADIEESLRSESLLAWIALEEGSVLGWVRCEAPPEGQHG